MKGEWRVSSNNIGGTKYYIAYRLLDIQKVDHGGNREYAGEYESDKKKVEKLVDELNGKEKEK